MRSLDEALAAALPRPAFSNGTDGEIWMSSWCHRCIHDKGTRDGSDPKGCDLVMVAFLGKTPSEWLRQDDGGDRYHCVEFRDEDDPGPGYEPPPDPPLPGQGVLFDDQPYRGARMFVDAVNEARPVQAR